MSQWQPEDPYARPGQYPQGNDHPRMPMHVQPQAQPQYPPANTPQWQQPYPPQQWQQPARVAPKSTGLAIVLGLLIPGLGCMYAGKAWLGIAILAAWMVS